MCTPVVKNKGLKRLSCCSKAHFNCFYGVFSLFYAIFGKKSQYFLYFAAFGLQKSEILKKIVRDLQLQYFKGRG